MSRWYQGSQVCYVYLSDVPCVPSNERGLGRLEIDHWALNSKFRESAWFTRGWTLQELLAPETVIFLDCQWSEIGTKSSLEGLISSVTGIDCLLDFSKACIAQKMSWASRETLREEDIAYSLMGLFDVHMPLLYGEGKHASLRLQLEILKFSRDESIFAWTENKPYNTQRGLLARSPASFKNSGGIFLLGGQRYKPYFMTNAGLQINLDLYQPAKGYANPWHKLLELRRYDPCVERGDETEVEELPSFLAPIFCFKMSKPGSIAIELVLLQEGDNTLARVNCDQFLFHDDHTTTPYRMKVFIKQIEIKQSRSPPVFVYADTTWFQARGLYIFTSYGRHECSPPSRRCSCITLEPPSIRRLPLMIVEEPVLVIFSGGELSFALTVDRNLDKGVGIALHEPANTLAVGAVDDMIRSFKTIPPMKQMRDRSSIKLLSGHMVSASLRKRVENQRLEYFILVNFDKSSNLGASE